MKLSIQEIIVQRRVRNRSLNVHECCQRDFNVCRVGHVKRVSKGSTQREEGGANIRIEHMTL